MPITISYDEWRRRTFSRTARRSTALKELDEAIRIRHEPAAKKALIEWIKAHNKKGKDWHTSVRNKDGVVEALYKELGILGSEVSYANAGQERDDQLAKEFIKKEQRLAKQKLFEGKKLKWKSSFTGVHKAKSDSAKHKLEARLKTAKGLKGHYDTVESTRKNILTIIDGITGNLPTAEANDLIKKVFGAEAAEFAKNQAPLIGAVTSGANAVKEWVQVANGIRATMDLESRSVSIRTGDPSAALLSVLALMEREIERKTAAASIHTAAFVVKTAGLAADAGAATGQVAGALESLAQLLNTLVDVVRDYKQMKAGNELLKAGKLDLTLFEKSPILGCYYIATMDDSTVMDFDIDNMGRENWQLEAQRLKVAIKPVVHTAGKLIAKSRVEIPGMDHAKGVYQQSMADKLKVWFYSTRLRA